MKQHKNLLQIKCIQTHTADTEHPINWSGENQNASADVYHLSHKRYRIVTEDCWTIPSLALPPVQNHLYNVQAKITSLIREVNETHRTWIYIYSVPCHCLFVAIEIKQIKKIPVNRSIELIIPIWMAKPYVGMGSWWVHRAREKTHTRIVMIEFLSSNDKYMNFPCNFISNGLGDIRSDSCADTSLIHGHTAQQTRFSIFSRAAKKIVHIWIYVCSRMRLMKVEENQWASFYNQMNPVHIACVLIQTRRFSGRRYVCIYYV